ncbi:MAG: RNA-binding S4 domain-containing protein [Erysipelotrichaceae bacterium]|nr:RNA-binding S4 domain-containing protein [Erysipelotrichaceae bacterium]
MRIDKYLKVARILKKRTVGKELALNDRLLINGRHAKASSEVKPGDVITIEFGHRTFKARVLEVRDNASKQDALGMYEVIEESKTNEV